MPAKSRARDDARRREHADRDRQIERGPGLADVAGREIDRDPRDGEVEAASCASRRGRDRGSPDAGVGQADQLKVGKPLLTSISTCTRQASTPMTVALSRVASMCTGTASRTALSTETRIGPDFQAQPQRGSANSRRN